MVDYFLAHSADQTTAVPGAWRCRTTCQRGSDDAFRALRRLGNVSWRRAAILRASAIVPAGHVVGDGCPQPIHIANRDFGLRKGKDDAGFIERVENRYAKIGACSPGFGEIGDVRVKLKVEAARTKILEINKGFGCGDDVGVVARNFEQDRFHCPRIASVSHAHGNYDSTDIVAKRPAYIPHPDRAKLVGRGPGWSG